MVEPGVRQREAPRELLAGSPVLGGSDVQGDPEGSRRVDSGHRSLQGSGDALKVFFWSWRVPQKSKLICESILMESAKDPGRTPCALHTPHQMAACV